MMTQVKWSDDLLPSRPQSLLTGVGGLAEAEVTVSLARASEVSLSHLQNISKPFHPQLTLSSFSCPGKQVPQASQEVPIGQ